VAIKPPWQMSWPLIMSSRTDIVSVALPGPTATTWIPSARVARSSRQIASRTASATACGVIIDP